MTRTARLAAAAISLIALVGCATAAEPEASTPASPSAEPAQSADPAPSTSEAPEEIDTSDWLEYATRDGDLTYRYPADWTLSSAAEQIPNPGRNRWYDSASLTAPNGQTLMQSTDYVDIGGACGEDDRFPIEVLASEPAPRASSEGQPAAEITTVALGTDDGRWNFGVGITTADRLTEPGATGCGWYFVHAGWSVGTRFSMASIEDDPLWTVDELDDATAYMETDEYSTLLEILRSVRTA